MFSAVYHIYCLSFSLTYYFYNFVSITEQAINFSGNIKSLYTYSTFYLYNHYALLQAFSHPTFPFLSFFFNIVSQITRTNFQEMLEMELLWKSSNIFYFLCCFLIFVRLG